jgi:hypothetical protein
MTGPAPSEAAIEAARRHAGNYRIIGSSIEAIVRAAYAVDFPSSGEAPALPSLEDTARLDWLERERTSPRWYSVGDGRWEVTGRQHIAGGPTLREAIDDARQGERS